MAIALAALEIAPKEAPDCGWQFPYVCGVLAVSAVSGAIGNEVAIRLHLPAGKPGQPAIR